MNPGAAVIGRVLIVNPCEESREVFRTVLARRGLTTIEAAGVDDGLEMARRHRPRVVVVDIEDEAADEALACARYDSACRQQQAALLVLTSEGAANGLRDEQVVSKPYHYGPLIRKIEQLCRRLPETESP